MASWQLHLRLMEECMYRPIRLHRAKLARNKDIRERNEATLKKLARQQQR